VAIKQPKVEDTWGHLNKMDTEAILNLCWVWGHYMGHPITWELLLEEFPIYFFNDGAW